MRAQLSLNTHMPNNKSLKMGVALLLTFLLPRSTTVSNKKNGKSAYLFYKY